MNFRKGSKTAKSGIKLVLTMLYRLTYLKYVSFPPKKQIKPFHCWFLFDVLHDVVKVRQVNINKS